MPFKRPPVAELKAWDRHAPVTVAQILIMGDKLSPDFDASEFDRRIGRRRGTRLPQAKALKFMMTALPELRLTVVKAMPDEVFFNPDLLVKFWVENGVKPHLARRYASSKIYERARDNTRDYLAVGKQFGPRRFQNRTVSYPRRVIEQALVRGAAAITADAESRAGSVMLTMSQRSPGKVRIFFPDDGMGQRPVTLDELEKNGLINLNHFGATIHEM